MSKSPAFRRAEPDLRRQSLIEACARVLAREGAGGTSVRTIAVETGVSAGLVGHYFGGIDALIEATYGHVEEQVALAIDAAVAAAGPDPRLRLEAFATASFRAPIADPALLATWIAFWSLVRARPGIASLHAQQYAAFRRRLEALLGQCGVAPVQQRSAAIGITALIDGLWLELCLSPETFGADEAARIVRAALDRITSTDQ